jgi:HEAT repeat protein
MDFVSSWVARLGPARFVFKAIVFSLAGVALLLAFIVIRRAVRQAHFRRREKRTLEIRRDWEAILDGRIAADQWCFHPLSCQIIETILLDRLEVASADEVEGIRHCLRISGLLDIRILEARKLRGWRRRQALVLLGRMRVPEAIPALAEGLDDIHSETRIAAARGLGRCGLPEAAEPILERVTMHQLHLPLPVLQNALLHCCRDRPSLLHHYVRNCDDALRPTLARVLAEIASAELGEDLVLLASDPLPEVRASAARALAGAKPRLALTALQQLATDEEWFVRLRAVVALGIIGDPRAIPVLMQTLCDPNRFVRLRSAAALAHMEGRQEEIIELALRTRDRYGLQALVSELQRSGAMLELLSALQHRGKRGSATRVLLATLRAGAHRFLLDALVNHESWRVRLQLARLLARSGETELLQPLEILEAVADTPRQRRILRWVSAQLRDASAAGREPVGTLQP